VSQERSIVTPEAVVLDIDTAGLGSRLAAVIVDALIQGGALGLLVLAADVLGAGISRVTAFLLATVVGLTPSAYGALFEGLWNGRTPGKRWQHLRVVQSRGQPVTWGQVVVRNLFRLLDLFLLVGPVLIVATRRSQRLGDLAAGTIVVREPKGPAPEALALGPDALRDALAHRLDTSGIGAREQGMLRDFLRRRPDLTEAGRTSVALQLADVVRARVPLSPDERVPDELLIEAVVLAVQGRRADAGGVTSGDGGP
jgi:uncharacterized RDD family membrane protein YckC